MEKARENIRWDLHERHLQSMFALHLMQDRFCDVTLACKDGKLIRAHRTILCACSRYFDSVLTGDTSGKDTLVIMKDCDYQDIQLIIQFIYYGEINVDQNRLRSLRKTADGLQIKGLTEAFHNFNEQNHCSFVVQKSEPALAETPTKNLTHVEGAAAYPYVDSEQLESKMDKKEPDWSDNEDENDCVLVYLVSEDEENYNSDRKQLADCVADRPASTIPKSFLPLRNIQMKGCNRNINESVVADVTSTDHNIDPLDGHMEFEEESDTDFNGWILTPVDHNEQQNGSISKEMVLKNILSRSHNRAKYTPVPSITSNNEKIGNRSAVYLPSSNSKLQKNPPMKPSSPSKSKPSTTPISHRPKTGTSKVDLLNRLQRSLQRKFDGRITELNIDDLQNYSVQNEKGSCQVKCPICDKLIKVHYGRYGGSSFWSMNNLSSHLKLHFK